MVLAGAAVLLLAWSVEPAVDAPASNVDVREVDFDDPARIFVTDDDRTIFDTPLRPVVAARDTPRDAPRTTTAGRPQRGTIGGGRGTDPGTRPKPVTGGGTSTPTPTVPTPTTPAPTTDGGTSIGGGSVPDPGTTPPPSPTPHPPTGGVGTPNSGIKVVVTGSGTTITVGAGIGVSTGRNAVESVVAAVVPPADTGSTASTTTSVTAGSTSVTLDPSTSSATVTAGGITLTVPLLGHVIR
jgi:hypothetical protein